MHIWSLSHHLLRLGHHVVVVTHAYGDCVGVRVLSSGLRVYYAPFPVFVEDNTFPALYASLPLLRDIFLRESITIVHGHQTTSTLTHEALMHAKVMGLATVFTDHSLFGFSDPASILVNKLLKFSLSTADACIGVSEVCRENLILRASLDPCRVVAMPNAVDARSFRPGPARTEGPQRDRVRVVILSRLAYRKGIDLVARVMPKACAKYPEMDFVVGGGGPKRVLLDETIERYALHSRVTLLGQVPHDQVRNVLMRGEIFLNCSLTESFCIAILEAACVGLLVVSTKVGGVPEVLPPDMIRFPDETSEDIVDGLVEALGAAMRDVLDGKIDAEKNHQRLASQYSWKRVAERTLLEVYDPVARNPPPTLLESLERYRGLGTIAGILAVWVVGIDALLLALLSWWIPVVEPAPSLKRPVR